MFQLFQCIVSSKQMEKSQKSVLQYLKILSQKYENFDIYFVLEQNQIQIQSTRVPKRRSNISNSHNWDIVIRSSGEKIPDTAEQEQVWTGQNMTETETDIGVPIEVVPDDSEENLYVDSLPIKYV